MRSRSKLQNQSSTSFFLISDCFFFLSSFWLEINYWWWCPISVSLTLEKKTPCEAWIGSEVTETGIKTNTTTWWRKWKLQQESTLILPWRPFWHCQWSYQCCGILECVFMVFKSTGYRLPQCVSTGCCSIQLTQAWFKAHVCAESDFKRE